MRKLIIRRILDMFIAGNTSIGYRDDLQCPSYLFLLVRIENISYELINGVDQENGFTQDELVYWLEWLLSVLTDEEVFLVYDSQREWIVSLEVNCALNEGVGLYKYGTFLSKYKLLKGGDE